MGLKSLTALGQEYRDQMSLEEARIFMGLYGAPDVVGTVAELEEHFGADAKVFQLAVLLQRLKAHAPDMRFSSSAILMAASLAPNVAMVVMWAYTLYRETLVHGLVNMSKIVDLFPMGFPTEAGYEKLWDEQKQVGAPLGNMVDDAAYWTADYEPAN